MAHKKGEQSHTDKAERKRKLAAQRQARFRAANPEVRGIFAPAAEHAEIKALVKARKKKRKKEAAA